MSQLLLREVVEHIALVFVLVQTLFEQPAARGLVLLHPGIMACDHMIQSVCFRPAKQVIDLAYGLDRWVSLFAGLDSIRDCIAFPKNNSGRDVMLDAPAALDQSQLDELNLVVDIKEDK